MTVELRPLGVACNLGCLYCYQQPQRDAGNQRTPYNLAKMKEEAARIGGSFTLFGGEPLLMPFDDLDDLFAWGKEKFGFSSIQTNGVLIEDRHIALFKRHKVTVGISIDGPGELNDIRQNGGIEKTRLSTGKVEAAIKKLCAEGHIPGLIITLHQGNATTQHLPRMIEWLHELDHLGIKSVRLHLLEVDDESLRSSLALTPQQNIEALLTFAEAEKNLKTIRFDTFRDMENLLGGRDGKASCVWRACDSYNTRAVQGIEGNGQASNCGRTNKEGIDFIKSETSGYERYVALYNTPQSDHGCAGCRFFLMCKGQCPGTAVNGDWRNRTENCQEWKRLFALIEKRMVLAGKTPLTLQPIRVEVEHLMQEAWRRNQNSSIEASLHAIYSQKKGPSTPPLHPQKSTARLSWVSMAAQALWEPRLPRIRAMLQKMAIHAGKANQSLLQVRHIAVSDAPELQAIAAEIGTGAALLTSAALPNATLPGPTITPTAILVTGQPEKVKAACEAFEAADHAEFHRLLDIPSCCLEQAVSTTTPVSIESQINHLAQMEAGPAEIAAKTVHHPLLVHLGLTALPVIPCSLHCQHAHDHAENLLQLAGQIGFSAEVNWLREAMAMALSWSTLHGITEIKTPLFKLCVLSATGTAETRLLRLGRTDVPAGAKGLTFPFARPSPLRFEKNEAVSGLSIAGE